MEVCVACMASEWLRRVYHHISNRSTCNPYTLVSSKRGMLLCYSSDEAQNCAQALMLKKEHTNLERQGSCDTSLTIS